MYNYYLQSASHHNNYGQINQYLYEATIKDIPIDMNTYQKLLSNVYFDYDVPFDRKDFITYLYLVFANDHSPEDF